MKAIVATGENIRNVMNFPTLLFLKKVTLIDRVASVVITKICTLLFIVSGLVIATILSYYLNIRLDHRAIIVYVKSRLRDSFSS